MPAKYIQRIVCDRGYFHVFNKGVSQKNIFTDEADYEVFLQFLKDYLLPLSHPDTYKKTFTVKGRTFRGLPHKKKNYFDKIELIAFNLKPDHFHLLLHQATKGSLEEFMRSLSTRYSMYFNKKNQTSGPLFEGPYKSVHLDGVSPLLYLTLYLHRSPEANGIYSSYAEYLGQRRTPWIKTNTVLSYFDKSENNVFKGIGGYQNFVEKYQLNQKDKELLEGIILEKEPELLEGSDLPLARSKPSFDFSLKIPEFTMATFAFVVLFSFGLKNVLGSANKNSVSIDTSPTINSTPSPSLIPTVAGIETQEKKTWLTVKINDDAESVNIRQSPTTGSEIIGQAREGDTFEFVSIYSGWYGIKLEGGSIGYISSGYLEITEETNATNQ